MNKKLLRSIPVVLLLINAASMVLPTMDTTQIVIAAAILGGLCYFVFTKPEESFTRKIYWYALAAMLLGVLVPGSQYMGYRYNNISSITDALGDFFKLNTTDADTAVMLISFGFLVVSQIWMKPQRFTWGLIIARYAALYIGTFTVAEYYLFVNPMAYRPVLMTVVSVSAASELFNVMMGQPKPATLRCFLFMLVYLMLSRMYYYAPYQLYGYMLENWITALVVLALAGLVVADNYGTYIRKSDQMAAYNSVAWAMIAWVAYWTLTIAFPVLHNISVMCLCFPMAFSLAVLCGNKLTGMRWSTGFAIAGGAMFAVLLALARTQMATVAAYALLVLVFGAGMCVSISGTKALSEGVRNTLLGIAGVVLLTAQRISLLSMPEVGTVALKLFAAIALCALWGGLCNRAETLQMKASSAYREEFQSLRYFGWGVPLGLLTIAFISILFNI